MTNFDLRGIWRLEAAFQTAVKHGNVRSQMDKDISMERLTIFGEQPKQILGYGVYVDRTTRDDFTGIKQSSSGYGIVSVDFTSAENMAHISLKDFRVCPPQMMRDAAIPPPPPTLRLNPFFLAATQNEGILIPHCHANVSADGNTVQGQVNPFITPERMLKNFENDLTESDFDEKTTQAAMKELKKMFSARGNYSSQGYFKLVRTGSPEEAETTVNMQRLMHGI